MLIKTKAVPSLKVALPPLDMSKARAAAALLQASCIETGMIFYVLSLDMDREITGEH